MESASFIFNGQLYEGTSLGLSPFDLGLTQGLGCFETLWAAPQKAPFAAAEHYQRFQFSAAKLHLRCPELAALLEQCAQLRQRLGLDSQPSRIRWTLWQGEAEQSQLLITAKLAQPPTIPARVQLSSSRMHSQAPLAGHKSSSYAAFALMLREAQQAGFDEAVYCNEHGELVEGSTSNLFLLRKVGEQVELHTPALSSGCLPGVTRRQILKLAQSPEFAQLEVQERRLKASDLADFQAAFLSNSQVGIRPISHLAGHEFDLNFSMLLELQKRFEQLRLGEGKQKSQGAC